MATVSIRLGRNLTSLEYKSDPTGRATRIMPIAQQVAGANTFLGGARWKVSSVSTLTVTLQDPAGGVGPIAYDGQTVGWKLYSEKTATTTAITSATATSHTVVVASVSNIASGDYVQFRDSGGLIPYYLDHPTYVATASPGVGVKFGTIDRSKIPGVANLVPNPAMRTWTTSTAMPDNWTTNMASSKYSQNTDATFTQLGGKSLLISTPLTNTCITTPPLPWVPEYTGQRMSARLRLYLPKTTNPALTNESLNWNGNFHGMEARLGILKTDGSLKMWMDPTEVATIVPPDSTVTGPNVTKVAADSWIDVVIQGLDITAASLSTTASQTLNGLTVGPVTAADLATPANITGYVVVLYMIQTPTGGGARYVYVDAAMLTVGLEAPDTLTEYGGANQLWQATNVVLGLLAPPQVSYSVDVVDLGRLNDVTADTFTLGGQVIVNDTELGVVNATQRVVEIEADELVPGSTRITLANRTRRLTDLLTTGSLSQSGSVTVGGGSTSTASGGSSSGAGSSGSTGTATGGPGTGTSGSTGSTSSPDPVVVDHVSGPTFVFVKSSGQQVYIHT